MRRWFADNWPYLLGFLIVAALLIGGSLGIVAYHRQEEAARNACVANDGRWVFDHNQPIVSVVQINGSTVTTVSQLEVYACTR